VLAQAFFPQLSQGVIPVVIQAWGNLLKMRISQRWEILSQRLPSKLGVRFAVGMGKDMHALPDKTAAAVHKTCIFAFQCGNGLLCLPRDIAGLLEEAPTHLPSLLGQGEACLMLLGFPARLDLPAGGQQGFCEVAPDMLHRLAMVGRQSGVRIDGFARCSKALRVIREGRGALESKHFECLEKLSGILPIF
jgi:hypothetical protein